MKIRTSFVSNSSSSSFIVIKHDGEKSQMHDSIYASANNKWLAVEVPNNHGQCEFGWEWSIYSSFEDKLNFVALQLIYLYEVEQQENAGNETRCAYLGQFKRLYAMLKEVCFKEFGFYVELSSNAVKFSFETERAYVDYHHYSIDHQSNVSENSCMEMFRSYQALRDFLKYDGSMVVGGNDNDDAPDFIKELRNEQ